MQISGVISFQNSWEHMKANHSAELDEIIEGLSHYIDGDVEYTDDGRRRFNRDVFEKAMYGLGWELNEKTFYSQSGRRVPIRLVGPLKNDIAVQISLGSPEFLTRWLFTHTTLATRHGVASIPVLLVPMQDNLLEEDRHRPMRRFNTFEHYVEQLEMLSPLSLGHAFLILGYSKQQSFLDVSIHELPQDENASIDHEAAVIDRSIEFPPEYHQAGIGILNYFATYLNEQYPEENATVRIEQTGLNVRMIVQTNEGNEEVIEKALHEYEMIVSGKERADKYTDNEKLILELRNELRVAKFRLESQQDIIALQNINAKKSEDQISGLLSILGDGLRNKGSNQINVEVNPCIQTRVAIEFNQDISLAIGSLEELMDCLPAESEAHLPLKDLEQSLASIEDEKDPEKVRRSSAMSKFRRILGQINEGNSVIKDAINIAEQGYDVAKDLAKKYNKIASWCGLPQVPEVFTK